MTMPKNPSEWLRTSPRGVLSLCSLNPLKPKIKIKQNKIKNISREVLRNSRTK
jgi:hypothetical protein